MSCPCQIEKQIHLSSMHSSMARLLRLIPLAALGVALAGGNGHAEVSEPSSSITSPFLWQVDGGAKPSYLFGTIHAGVSAAELPPQVGDALAESSLFVMETSPSQAMIRSTGARPMDLELAEHARRSGVQIGSLETLRFQLDLMAQLGNSEEIAAMLSEQSSSNELRSLATAYRSGDQDVLRMATGPSEPALQELLLDSRNRRWVHKLSPILGQGGVFVAVGAGHMPGPQGLVSLLGQRGFSATRALSTRLCV